MLLLLCALLFCWGMLPQAQGTTHGPLFLRINKNQLETGESQGMSLDKHGLQESRAVDNSSGLLLWCPFTSVHSCPCPSSALTLATSSPRPAIQTFPCPPYHLPSHRGHGCLLGCCGPIPLPLLLNVVCSDWAWKTKSLPPLLQKYLPISL